MEMTIDEAIEIINHYLDYPQEEVRKALLLAIEIMHKHQKIEEIYKNWCYPTYFNATDAMNKLGEVLKDGNNN